MTFKLTVKVEVDKDGKVKISGRPSLLNALCTDTQRQKAAEQLNAYSWGLAPDTSKLIGAR